jgi:hypothetical protein
MISTIAAVHVLVTKGANSEYINMIAVKIYGFLRSKSTATGRKIIDVREIIIEVIRVFFLVLKKLYNFLVKICNIWVAVGSIEIIAIKKGFALKYNARLSIINPCVLRYIPLKNIPSRIEYFLVSLTAASVKAKASFFNYFPKPDILMPDFPLSLHFL